METYEKRTMLIVGIFAAVVCAVLAWFGVFDIPHTLVIIAIVIITTFLINQMHDVEPHPWPAPPLKFRVGARTEVARLAWATVTRDGEVSAQALNRVRPLAQRALAAHGVQWSGLPGEPMVPLPVAQQLIGAAAVNTLTSTGGVRPRAFANVVTRLENLRSE